MRILQVNTSDGAGGAEAISRILHLAYRQSGHDAHLAVGTRITDLPAVIQIQNDARRCGWSRLWIRMSQPLLQDAREFGPRVVIGRFLELGLGQPRRLMDRSIGHEDFDFPATCEIPSLPPSAPEVMHLHNLHGRYFDLRALPQLSQQFPVLVTLHDMWLLTGHCAYSLDCERWATGCGHCPDLSLYPAVWRDATAFNHRRKASIYRRSRLYVATPSRWLMRELERSILMEGVLERRFIPYGIDLSKFSPGDRMAARGDLRIPLNAAVLLFAAQMATSNPYKDFSTIRRMVQHFETLDTKRPIVMIALGADRSHERVGNAEIRFVPFEIDPTKVARYYIAADLYVHAAQADNFPLVILEALACGTPVVATGVGGIPEQVDEGLTGHITPPRDPKSLADGVLHLLNDDNLRERMGRAAAAVARDRYDLKRMVRDYVSWYAEILEQRKTQDTAAGMHL